MKKKLRIRKRPITEGSSESDDSINESISPEVVESVAEETSPEPAADLSKNGKLEVIAGFAIMGVSIGFLAGYGNLDIMTGIAQGLMGLVLGGALGYLPYLNLKSPLTS
jgi:hypothetical protein